MKTFRYVGLIPQDLASGALLEPGQQVKLDEDDLKDPHNKRYVDENLLIEVKPAEKTAAKEGGKD